MYWGEPGMPCFYCGVRPDVTCKHRPGKRSPPKQEPVKKKDMRKFIGQGYNFRGHKDERRKKKPSKHKG